MSGLVVRVADRAGLTRDQAAGAVDAALAAVERELTAGGEVTNRVWALLRD